MGGLPRRATVVDEARTKGPVFVVDGGNLYWRSGPITASTVPQQQEKARLQAEAYALAGVDAMLPAAGDLRLGLDFVKETMGTWKLPYVASDLVCDGAAPFPVVQQAERGGIRMAVVGLVGEVDLPGCTRKDGAVAVREALGRIDADVVVLLSGETEQDAARVVEKVGGIDFVVVADQKTTATPTLLDGGALRLGSGSRGKRVGALTFTLVPGAKGWRDDDALGQLASDRDRYQDRLTKMKDELARLDGPEAAAPDAADPKRRGRLERQIKFYGDKVAETDARLAAASAAKGTANRATNALYDLDDKVADQPATLALLEKAKVKIAAAAPSAAGEGPVAFVGTEACAACHANEAAQWRTTAHSRAWATLAEGGHQLDQACFSCHVTGAKLPGGPTTAIAARDAHLTDVGCEACHGPGRAHATEPAVARLDADPSIEVCLACHDGQQDGGRFDITTYLPQVRHAAAPAP